MNATFDLSSQDAEARSVHLPAKVGPGDRLVWPADAVEAVDAADTDVTDAGWLWFDVLLDGETFVTFEVVLLKGDDPIWRHAFSPLTSFQTRIVTRLSFDRWRAADHVAVRVLRKTEAPAGVQVTRPRLSPAPPARLETPVLPRGPLLDELGQSRLHTWPGRTESVEALVDRLRTQRREAPGQRWPEGFSRWGGWSQSRVEPTGFFRTHHDGARWWLVDPDGCLFWSAGVDCVHPTIDHEARYETRWMNLRPAFAWLPEPDGPMGHALGRNPWHSADDREVNFTVANFTRAFGADGWRDAWVDVAHAQLRRTGFNTIGDWSDEPAAARAKFPYVRPLELGLIYRHAPTITPGMPDMFHPGLASDLTAWARQLTATRDDSAMIGYFLHNEPAWHFEGGNPAQAMLRAYPAGPARDALADWLRRRYPDDASLAAAWGMTVTFADIRTGIWNADPNPAATPDLQAFSTVMIGRLADALSAACRAEDPHHLNLGVRWWTFPPAWALRGMASFDVISFNCYQPRMNMTHYGRREPEPGVAELAAELHRPFLVGEWHFGALGAGLASAGLYRAEDETQRARAYRVYLEHAAAEPWCVGAHWFNLYDRTALYSPQSNENYHIGFMDICNREHEAITLAARASHERLYDVVSGRVAPYDEPVSYAFPSR